MSINHLKNYHILYQVIIMQIGENGSKEYSLSNNLRENILQLFFQLTRTNNQASKDFICSLTDKILSSLISKYQYGLVTKEEYIEYMSIMYRMIGHTRDIIEGKGEYELSYLLLLRWNIFYPKLANYALKLFVSSETGDIPYGSWKDIKYLYGLNSNSSLIAYGCYLMIEQLKKDIVSENPSLLAKWIPRENSKYGDLFTILATTYFTDYLITATTPEKQRKAIVKSKMDFRKIISSLNKQLDTVQIKQCDKRWSEIVPSNQTSITMHKQKNAFLNLNKQGKQRYDDEDRIICATQFRNYVKEADEIKGQNIGLNDFTKEALNIIERDQIHSDEATILNAQWKNYTRQSSNLSLGKMIAMVNVSESMAGDPVNAAISLGIWIAEKSMFGKRVITFGSSPEWINLSDKSNFVDMVKLIKETSSGLEANSNFKDAFDLILDAIVSQRLRPEDVEDMSIIILSDMQMDYSDYTLTEQIEKCYAEAGMKLWNKPFKPPHILFWNLRSTTGFPCLATQHNTSMLSGYSPDLLNHFCDEGANTIHSCTPWTILTGILNNKRYDTLDKYLRELFY